MGQVYSASLAWWLDEFTGALASCPPCSPQQAGFEGFMYFVGSAVNAASQDLLQNQYSCPS